MLLLDKLNTCHGASVVGPDDCGTRLVCGECGNCIVDFVRDLDPFTASKIALEFQNWSGCDPKSLRCVYPLVDLPGILPVAVSVSLFVLTNGVRLLGALNDAVLLSDAVYDEEVGRIFVQFLQDFVALVDDRAAEDDPTTQAVRTLLVNMKDLFRDVDLFKQYVEKVAPYVRSCCEEEYVPLREEINDDPVSRFRRESLRSTFVRKRYSSYCVTFDVLHVMVYCYVCALEADVVANLVLDLGARVCLGNFQGVGPRFGDAKRLLDTVVASRKTDARLYYFLRDVRSDAVEECLSPEFVEKYCRLQKIMEKKLAMDGFAFSQLFPHVLFAHREDDAEYFGFVVALAHLAAAKGRKGSYAESKKIYRFVRKVVRRTKQFKDQIWTKDVFQLFLASDDRMEKEMVELLAAMIGRE